MNKYLTSFILILIFIFFLIIKFSFIITGNGFFEFLISLIFKPLVILLTFIVLIFNFKPKWNRKLFFLNIGIGISAIIVYSHIVTKEKIYKLDWYVNKEKREKIVELTKNGKLENQKIPDSLKLSLNCSPNEFRIQKKTDSTITILFYTDFGLNDHYSGFVYSNDPLDLKQLNENVLNGGNDNKITENWFELNE